MLKRCNKSNKHAVFFDLDGTLIDSEPITEQVVANWLKKKQHPIVNIPSESLHGITWYEIAKKLQELKIEIDPALVATELENDYFKIYVKNVPKLLRGARNAFREAALHGCTAIVTGSSERFVANFLTHENLINECRFFICSEYYSESKPDPEPYITAARYANCTPKDCLVFEDSLSGVQSALQAGMRVVAVGSKETPQKKLAHLAISNFEELHSDFFSNWFKGQLVFDSQSINLKFFS